MPGRVKLRDVNLFVTTDVHSFIGSHFHADGLCGPHRRCDADFGALASFLETIENVEAAELGGDSYNVHEAMLCDGLGTMFGAICGATIPTTVRRPKPPQRRTA